MLKLEEHEKNINELTTFLKVEGVDQAKVSTILQAMRDNYTEVTTTVANTSKQIEDNKILNEGLRSANMMLLSKLGTPPTPSATPPATPPSGETVKSLDDLALEFLK